MESDFNQSADGFSAAGYVLLPPAPVVNLLAQHLAQTQRHGPIMLAVRKNIEGFGGRSCFCHVLQIYYDMTSVKPRPRSRVTVE